MKIPIPFLGLFSRAPSLALDAIHTTRPADPAARDVARAAAAELAAVPARRRVKAAESAGLPLAAARLGAAAGPLLAFIIDDDTLRPRLGAAAVATWLDVDRAACVPHALARAASWPTATVWRLVDGEMDPSEVYDVIAPLLRTQPALRRSLVGERVSRYSIIPPALPTLSDARFVALALELFPADPACACAVLGANGTPRAVEELNGVLERGPWIDDTVVAAMKGLERALDAAAFIDVLAAFLGTDAATYMTNHQVLADIIVARFRDLDRHPLVRGEPRARESLRSFVGNPADVTVG